MKDYTALPVFMEAEEIAEAFQEILDAARTDPEAPALEIAEALVEVIDRHAELYRPLDAELSAQIVAWIKNHWPTDDIELADALSTVIVNLSVPDRAELLRRGLESRNPEVRELVEDALTEV
jgi:hypothetical protein